MTSQRSVRCSSEQWQLKYERSPNAVHDRSIGWIRDGVAAGAPGGKLVGAGGGGFLLFYADDEAGSRARCARRARGSALRIDYLGDDRHRRRVALPVGILAGGLGTRLHTVSDSTLPKALVPVVDRPFIDHKLEELRARGVREVVFLIGHGGDQIRRHVGTGADFGLNVTYLDDGPSLLGTGGAIRAALPALGPSFWFTYGYSLLDVDVDRAEEQFLSTPACRHDDRSSECRSDRAEQRTGRG